MSGSQYTRKGVGKIYRKEEWMKNTTSKNIKFKSAPDSINCTVGPEFNFAHISRSSGCMTMGMISKNTVNCSLQDCVVSFNISDEM